MKIFYKKLGGEKNGLVLRTHDFYARRSYYCIIVLSTTFFLFRLTMRVKKRAHGQIFHFLMNAVRRVTKLSACKSCNSICLAFVWRNSGDGMRVNGIEKGLLLVAA